MFDEVYQSVMLVSYLYYFDNNLLLSSVVLSFKMCRVTYHFYSTVILGNRVFIRKQQSAQNPILAPRIYITGTFQRELIKQWIIQNVVFVFLLW